MVRKPGASHTVQVLPRLWAVERTLAWLSRRRCLSKGCEERTESSKAKYYNDGLWRKAGSIVTESSGASFVGASGPFVAFLNVGPPLPQFPGSEPLFGQ